MRDDRVGRMIAALAISNALETLLSAGIVQPLKSMLARGETIVPQRPRAQAARKTRKK